MIGGEIWFIPINDFTDAADALSKKDGELYIFYEGGGWWVRLDGHQICEDVYRLASGQLVHAVERGLLSIPTEEQPHES